MLGLIWSVEPILPPSLIDILAQGEDLEKEKVYRNNSKAEVEEEMEIRDRILMISFPMMKMKVLIINNMRHR